MIYYLKTLVSEGQTLLTHARSARSGDKLEVRHGDSLEELLSKSSCHGEEHPHHDHAWLPLDAEATVVYLYDDSTVAH